MEPGPRLVAVFPHCVSLDNSVDFLESIICQPEVAVFYRSLDLILPKDHLHVAVGGLACLSNP